MTTFEIFEPDGRAIPYLVEGDGPVSLVLLPEPGQDALGVVAHYLAEEAGFHLIRIGYRSGEASLDERAQDVLDVMGEVGLEHAWIGGHGFGGTVARVVVTAGGDRANGLLLLGVENEDIALAPLIPVLIVQGAEDEVTPPAHGENLQTAAPERASIKTVDGAGHLFPLTHPIETAVMIEEYLDWD